MSIGPTPPPDGGQNARLSTENDSLATFVFGLVALAAILVAVATWAYLSSSGSETVPADPVTTTIAR